MKSCDFIVLSNKEVREIKEGEDPTLAYREKIKKRVWVSLSTQEWNQMMTLKGSARETYLNNLI